jgi:alginate O-acetyltransferase complex protein AlgI
MIQDFVFWLFLGATVVVFWLLPVGWRLPALSIGSLGIIAYLAPDSAAVLTIMAIATWFLLPIIAQHNRTALLGLLALVGITAGPLVLLKFTSIYGIPWLDGSHLKLLVPLGMSYYVFRLVHVAIEAYRHGERPTDPVEFFNYAFLFTIFVAGPIERYDNFTAQRSARFDPVLFRDGLTRIVFGLIKQGVLIEALNQIRRIALGSKFHLQNGAELLAAPPGEVWLLLLISYLVAYLNLGAYSDVAIGASRLFGLRISENFNYPIAARNLSDFWRRWHMTLSGWCQSYIFSPVLGLTRSPYLALIASFQVMGLWHLFTVNRIGWGLFQAAGLIGLYAWRKRTAKAAFGKTWWWATLAWFLTQSYATLGFLFVHEEQSNNILMTLRIMLHLLTFGLLQ